MVAVPQPLGRAWRALAVVAVLLLSGLAVGAAHGPAAPRPDPVTASGPPAPDARPVAPSAAARSVHPLAGTPSWTNISSQSANSPPPRESGGMVYDSTDGYVLLFGGELTGIPFHYYNDTWSFVGGVWTNRTSGAAPSPRFGFYLADDPADHVVVLFGGQQGYRGVLENDTWTYHAGVWTNVTSTVAPPGAFWGSMSYDSGTGTVILFGGNARGNASTEYSNDTWSYHAGVWTELAPPTSPPGRDDQNQVDDVGAGGVVMFGGLNSSSDLNDTWLFAGGSWSLLTTATGPDTRAGPGMAYDAAEGAAVMFGGYPANDYFYTTWVLQAGIWTPYTLNLTPAAGTIWGQMTYDAADEYVVLFQGDGSWNSTWELSFSANVSTPLELVANATPQTGTAPLSVNFTATASGGTPPYSFAWTFGDGGTSTVRNPEHTYETADAYSANLVVTDDASAMASKSWTITVTSPNGPPALTATISATPQSALTTTTVTFASDVSGGTRPYTFLWEFADHSSAQTANATHEYAAVGTYDVTFLVNDSVGGSVTKTVTVTVSAVSVPPPNTPPSSSSPSKTLEIVLGVLLVIVIVFVVFFAWRRKRKPEQSLPAATPTPPPPS
ncbi:MAG: PKD domain-containing protein [Thermoplasmata archaeon]|nr:PKD domain-containing protein [Thermoplasmata archaeon]